MADFSPRQVLITSSGAYRRHHLTPNTLRENILIDADRLDWRSGGEVQIGRTVVLRVMFTCEACAKLNKFRPRLMAQVGSDRGILARVIRGGTIVAGDPIIVRPGVYEALSDEWQERLCAILERLPAGGWVSYIRLAELNGVHRSYCRVFPRVLDFARYGSVKGPTTGVRRSTHGALEPVLSSLPAADPMWSGSTLFAGE